MRNIILIVMVICLISLTACKEELVVNLDAVTAPLLATGYDFALVARPDGILYGIGNNLYGQLGSFDFSNTDELIEVGDSVKSVSAGFNHSLILKFDGTIEAWGNDSKGQLAKGQNLKKIRLVYAGGDCSFAIDEENTMYAWGDNEFGQLGLAATEKVTTPTKVIDNISKIASNGYLTLTLSEEGRITQYGSNSEIEWFPDNKYISIEVGNKAAYAVCENYNLWKTDYTGTASIIDKNVEYVSARYNHVAIMYTDWTVNHDGVTLTEVFEVAAGFKYSIIIDVNGKLYATENE